MKTENALPVYGQGVLRFNRKGYPGEQGGADNRRLSEEIRS